MVTAAQLAERMKEDIVSDVRNGFVPPTVRCFSELHDYVDANCYGGTERLLSEIERFYPETTEGRHAALQALCDLMNDAMAGVNAWLAEGSLATCLTADSEPHEAPAWSKAVGSDAVIPSLSDKAASKANMEAIDRMVHTDRYRHVVAWGKWLGFTPETVRGYVELAHADNAPADSVQKIDGRWLTLSDINNEDNRKAVEALAARHSVSR